MIRSEMRRKYHFSPFQHIAYAEHDTWLAQKRSTEKGMLNASSKSICSETDLHPAFNALLLAIEESQNRSDSEMAGSHFQLNSPIPSGTDRPRFKTRLSSIPWRKLRGGVFLPLISGKIRIWLDSHQRLVAEETYKIEDLIPEGAINAFTRLVLANAIYFKGSWMHPFNENLTIDAPFYTIDGTEIIAKRMKLLGKDLIYKRGENYQAVSLPYLSSDFVMTLLVPDAGAFHEVEDQLDQAMLEAILSSLWTEKVDLEMPKFDFDTNIKANDPLIVWHGRCLQS